MIREKTIRKEIAAKIKKYMELPFIFGMLSVIILAGMMISVLLPGKQAQAAPYLGCSANGFIFKYQGNPDTDVRAIDMVTGTDSSAGTITARNFNAVGYNPNDNYFYGWDLTGSGTFMRFKSDFSAAPESLTISSYSGPTTNIFAGDVDENGHYWFFTVGGTTTWYEVDLTTPVPTFIGSGNTANPTGNEGTDWAYIPGTDSLYRGMDNGTNITIVAFNRTTKTYSTIGVVSNITAAADRNMGAVYADPDGNFYMSSHQSGRVWRVDLSGTPPFTAQQLGASDANSNDGARCALASVPVDLGDAPDTYQTLIGSDGPRHSIANFNINTSTAPLMLGTHIDIEADGFPGVQAKGDDNDHQGSAYVDDERGVTSIVATPGTPTALRVPVKVTNTSASAATLAGWIDLDNDQIFEAGERVTTSIPANSGTVSYELNFPSTTFTTNTYARFRVFSGTVANPLPTEPVTGGEVEDVLVQVGSYDASKTANPAEGSMVSPGQNVTYTITIQNTGATALTNLKIDDDLSNILDDATVEGMPTVTPGSAGTATINGNILEFVGDIPVGQSVVVAYTVKIKALGTLGNSQLLNTVTAAHSTSCHPDVVNGALVVSDSDCQTNHTVNTTPLPSTGSNIILPIIVAAGLAVLSGIGFLLARRQQHHDRK
ncbi:MAG TPA: GEVED domain-containing protein [Candidatus Saccharimonadales bacterium]|nr:GEVED domain-containing protein [Candidatus Saccharimonadales bacterium]